MESTPRRTTLEHMRGMRSETPEAATLAFEESLSGMDSLDVAAGATDCTFATAPMASGSSFALPVTASSASMGPLMAALEAARAASVRRGGQWSASSAEVRRRPGTPIPSRVKHGSSLETLESVTASLLGAAASADADAGAEDGGMQPGVWRRIGSAVFGRSPKHAWSKESAAARGRTGALSLVLSPKGLRGGLPETHGRARGTVSPATGHRWLDHGGRARRIRSVDVEVAAAWTSVDTRSTKDALYAAPGPSAMHRALEAEWRRGIMLIRSVRVRALDADAHDATGVAAYFALTDLFTLAYFGAVDRLLGTAAASPQRAAAADALARFAAARDAFMDGQGADAADKLARSASAAREAVLSATDADARALGVGGHALIRLGVRELADAFASVDDAGPLLVLLLARGVVDGEAERARWARGVLFPQRFRRPRRLGCMKKVAAMLAHVHDEHARVAGRAEYEYRVMFESRAWERETQLMDLDEGMQREVSVRSLKAK